MIKFKWDNTYYLVIVITVLLIVLRFVGGVPENFKGNLLSIFIFGFILITLFFTLLFRKYEAFILVWLSFYYACPIIKLPFIPIGSLGLFNGIFLPIIIILSIDFDGLFNFRAKNYFLNLLKTENLYLMIILCLFFISFLNLSTVGIRSIMSSLFELIAPFVFFLFTVRKCKKTDVLIYGSLMVALITSVLGIYELIAKPEWGTLTDWRSLRIFGNLFWHNSYSFYLVPILLTLYLMIRESLSVFNVSSFLLLFFLNIMTLSRGGLAVLMIALFTFEFLYKTGFKMNLKKGVMILGAILAVVAFFFLSSYLSERLQPDSIVERTAIWETVLPFIKASPIYGNGLGSYELYTDQILHGLPTHNYYLFVMFQLGILGLFCIICFLLIIFFEMLKKIISNKSTGLSEAGIGLIAAILAYSMIGNSAFAQVVSLNTWIMLACYVKDNEKN